MNNRTTWATGTAALGICWVVVVAFVVWAFTDWHSDMRAVIGGVISGIGVAVILVLRIKRFPGSSSR